jgi:hypothetical protein
MPEVNIATVDIRQMSNRTIRLLFVSQFARPLKGKIVKKLVAILGAMIISMPTFAADNACMTQAAEKKLSGAAQNSYIKKCVRDGCETTSSEKKLAGAAKNSFTKKCIADGLQPYCEKQAAAKKLAGAAQASFMKKCQSGN